MIRKRFCAAALAVITVIALYVPASAAGVVGPTDIILSWTGGTSTTETVSWHADASSGQGILLYGTSPSLAGAASISAKAAVPTSGITLDYTIWRAVMSGLKPATTYYYAVQNSGSRSGISSFTTGDDSASAFSFLYMGDIHMGVGSPDTWGKLLDSAYQRNPAVAFGIFGGDIADSGISAFEWQEVLDRASPVFSKIPLMPVNGNHESNFPDGKPKLYLDLLDLPKNGPSNFQKEFYSYDYGDCHITALNSWVFSGEQKLTKADYQKINDWVAEDLASSHAKWKIVVMHNPIYKVASDKVCDAVRQNWAPLFEKGGVSLILCGHQHVYARSYPMTDGQIDYNDGITSVLGNASQKYYGSADETYQVKTMYNVSNYEIVKIDGDTLTVQSYDPEGNEFDNFSIKPRTGNGTHAVFSDVPDGTWYTQGVNYVAERGLMSGTSDRVFSPDAPLTRAMAAALFYRLSGSPQTGSAAAESFHDVPADAWFAQAVSWLSSNGIMTGTGGGLFDPGSLLTREQLAAILCHFAAYEKSDTTAYEGLSGFNDAGDVSPWAQKAMAWAVGHGFLNGSDGQLKPTDTASRAQAASILTKYCLGQAQ